MVPPTYFPVLPLDATEDMLLQMMPVATNQPLDGSHPGVTRAILAVHDETRDASGVVAGLSALAGTANQTTLILAPQFLLRADLQRLADSLPNKGNAFAVWNLDEWEKGEVSLAPPGGKGVSSFTVMDLLLMYLADRRAFPDLTTIVITGYGLGGNFVQRYDAFNLAGVVLAAQPIDLRYVIAGASSYLYPTANRPLGGRKGFGLPDAATCPLYDSYPYGLKALNAYTRHVGGNAAKINYGSHVTLYLAAPPDLRADTSCAAATQGHDSLARAHNYGAYLHSLYGDDALVAHLFSFPANTPNSATGLWSSPCGMRFLFGDGTCPSAVGDES